MCVRVRGGGLQRQQEALEEDLRRVKSLRTVLREIHAPPCEGEDEPYDDPCGADDRDLIRAGLLV